VKRLEDLPYRFWPKHAIPEGIEVQTKVLNQKAEKFKPAYTRTVNPVLKATGFKCSGTTARRLDEKLWCMVWYGTGKYGGSGEVVIAAHFPGFPASGEFAITADKFSYPHALFLRPIELVPGECMFDLGWNLEQGLETAQLMAEAFAEQGPPYLEALARAEETLLAVEIEHWVDQMTALYQSLAMRLVDFNVRPGDLPHAAAAQLLARLHARAGHAADARAFAERGIAAIETPFAEHRHAYHTWKLRFEKLIQGDSTFVLDANDRAEVDRRVAAEKA
jgi:hypothetical protein